MTTITGETRRIGWIGQSRVDCHQHPTLKATLPVRIQANAFGPDLPKRDLYLSPDHALYLEGVLIPMKYPINGDAVAQIGRSHVDYYHRHSIAMT